MTEVTWLGCCSALNFMRPSFVSTVTSNRAYCMLTFVHEQDLTSRRARSCLLLLMEILKTSFVAWRRSSKKWKSFSSMMTFCTRRQDQTCGRQKTSCWKHWLSASTNQNLRYNDYTTWTDRFIWFVTEQMKCGTVGHGLCVASPSPSRSLNWISPRSDWSDGIDMLDITSG